MDGIRRTVPRSARRTPRPSAASTATAAVAPNPRQQQTPRYVPSFTPSVNKQRQFIPTSFPSNETISASHKQPITTVSHCTTPQTCVRWLPATPGARQALALSGSSDYLTLHAVWNDHTNSNFNNSQQQQLSHSIVEEIHYDNEKYGTVSSIDIACDTDNSIFTSIGSTNGTIHLLRHTDYLDSDNNEWILSEITTPKNSEDDNVSNDSIVGIASLPSCNNRIVTVTENGVLSVFSSATSQLEWSHRVDQVGINSLTTIDETSAQVAGASVTGCITVWDARSASVSSKLSSSNSVAATCVTVDSSQPHYVIAGFENGNICTWDRRRDDSVVTNTTVHHGIVWDVRVVGGNRPGRLMTCGEDGMVLLLDYAMAAARHLGDVEFNHAVGPDGVEDIWKAAIEGADVRGLVGQRDVSLGVNAVDAHPTADLFAFANDSAEVGFGMLS